MARRKISRSAGNKIFGHGTFVHTRNISGAPMRGGIRL